MIGPDERAALTDVLIEARELGFLGPGPVADHFEHSLAFVSAWATLQPVPPTSVVDLGSGGGVPGLVLAAAWPESEVVLLDGSERRVAFLTGAVDRLGLSARVRALAERAEVTGHSVLRGAGMFVAARGFAAPAVTAECGAALLQPGGILAVSEPPGGDPNRWPPASLAAIGLESIGLLLEPAAIQLLRQAGPYPSRYPRRVGIPTKRPLWAL